MVTMANADWKTRAFSALPRPNAVCSARQRSQKTIIRKFCELVF